MTGPVGARLGTVYTITAYDSLIVPGTRVRVVSQRPAAGGGVDMGAALL